MVDACAHVKTSVYPVLSASLAKYEVIVPLPKQLGIQTRVVKDQADLVNELPQNDGGHNKFLGQML